MSHTDKTPLPPPYSDSQDHTLPSPHRGQTILTQLALTRATQIRSIITTHIIPLIEHQASYGIAQTTIALLPSDIRLPAMHEKSMPEKSDFSFPTPSAQAVAVVGFSSAMEPQIVRLDGPVNRTEFWRVQAVVSELERVLRESLNASPVLASATRHRSGDGGPAEKGKRSFLSRVMPSMGPEKQARNAEGGVSRAEETGLVLVEARLEEICLRTVNEFGMYDTMNKQCVIVRVDARC